MPELLFEIGVEELPAHSLEPATAFMADYFEAALKERGLAALGISVQATPRRLVLMCDDVAIKQEDCEEEILGPSVTVAYEQPGVLSKAGLGFIRAKGIDESALFIKKTDKGDVIAAKIFIKGKDTASMLPEILHDMMRKIPFKKRMRWEESGESFARPVRWMVTLFDGHNIEFKFADVQSGKYSYGHRFLSPEAFLVGSKQQYLDELSKRYVMLDAKERAQSIYEQASHKVKALNGQLLEDPELMDTVKNLVEYPFVVVGSFDEEYLSIPEEILISEMKVHQKYFAVYGQNKQLKPYFICVAGVYPHDEQIFAQGNARVLRARFDDGAFYFAEDQKKTLAKHAQGLASLVFERELGTVKEKSERIETIALELAKILSFDEQKLDCIKEAAPLLKADLVCGVVGQFPELQGVMGSIYARKNGHSEDVCEAIKTHYWPRFSEDNLPVSKVSAILSIADKIDTLVGIMAIGKGPKGNKDPFALRRCAIAIVRILTSFGFDIEVPVLIGSALARYQEKFASRKQELSKEITEFFIQRARGVLIEELSSEDRELAVSFADAVLAVSSANLCDVFSKARILLSLRKENPENFDSLAQTIKRASNIVKKAQNIAQDFKDCDPNAVLTLSCEKELIASVEAAKGALDYKDLFARIVLIKPKLDAFFENVMVMVDDDKLKLARLSLLNSIKNTADKIADFTHL